MHRARASVRDASGPAQALSQAYLRSLELRFRTNTALRAEQRLEFANLAFPLVVKTNVFPSEKHLVRENLAF